jgi:hypothetical protein
MSCSKKFFAAKRDNAVLCTWQAQTFKTNITPATSSYNGISRPDNKGHSITLHKTDFNIHHFKDLKSPAAHWLLWYLHELEVKITLNVTTEFYECWTIKSEKT